MSQEPKRGHFAKEKGEIILREHEYDGIQEYDQKLPNWWLFTFYGAIAWFIGHWAVYYHTNSMKSSHELVTEQIVAVQNPATVAYTGATWFRIRRICVTVQIVYSSGESTIRSTCTRVASLKNPGAAASPATSASLCPGSFLGQWFATQCRT